MTILEYAKMVDARDKAQQEYFAYKRKFKVHNRELYEKSRDLEKAERQATAMILEAEEGLQLFNPMEDQV